MGIVEFMVNYVRGISLLTKRKFKGLCKNTIYKLLLLPIRAINIVPTKELLEKLLRIGLIDALRQTFPIRRLRQTQLEFKYYEIDEKGRMNIKKLYFDPFIDMYNSEIISYSIARRPSSQSIVNALNEAIDITSDCKY